MQNIIKALNYKVKRDNVTYYALLAVVVCFFMISSDFNGIFSSTGSEYFIGMQDFMFLPVGFFLVILATRICGWDYVDKTMNYELLIGHNRKEVFWSRIWVSFIWCVPITIGIIALPPVILTLINGWGIYMDMGEVILRCVLICFTIIRMYSELVLLTFLTKSCYIGLIVGYLFLEIGAMLPMLLEEFGIIKADSFAVVTSGGNFIKLMTFDNYSFKYINGKDEMFFDAGVEPSLMTATIIVSLLVSAACILISWLYFRKSDMK